jgi:hypothetical protein
MDCKARHPAGKLRRANFYSSIAALIFFLLGKGFI